MTAPTPPAARDAGVGERVSVDTAVLDRFLACAFDSERHRAELDVRPLPPAVVGAATLAEWTATIARYRAAGDARGQFGDPLVANLAGIAERACALLAAHADVVARCEAVEIAFVMVKALAGARVCVHPECPKAATVHMDIGGAEYPVVVHSSCEEHRFDHTAQEASRRLHVSALGNDVQ